MDADSKPGPAPEPKRRDAFSVFLIVACIALSVLVLLLARENRRLKAEIGSAGTSRLPPDALKSGDTLEPFELLDEAGSKVEVAFPAGSSRTLLLVFSSRCPACEKTLPVWNELLSAGAPRDCRVLGVRTDRDAPAGGALFTAAFRFPVHTVPQPEPALFAGGKLPYVPAAVLLDAHGRVSRVWFGVPSESDLRELRDALAG